MFLAMSGVIGATSDEVVGALRSLVTEHRGSLEAAALTTDDDDCLVVAAADDRVTVLYPGNFFDWDEASAELSQRLQKPVFSLHIHDGDFWMYQFFDKGESIDQFNPMPEYWEELEEDERDAWGGDADLVAQRIPGLSADKIAAYLVLWGDDVLESDLQTKAYPGDKFGYGSDWQLVDFMNKLGLPFPTGDQGEPRGPTYRFICKGES
jgi:hypothetical protein